MLKVNIMQLPERKLQILKAIVENYINTAEPVGSKAVADSFSYPISSATIRNEMGELEEMGFLEKPHVSAGRIPSYSAYRIYVDELMEGYRLASDELQRIKAALQQKIRDLDTITINAAKVVASLTSHAAISMTTRKKGYKVKKAELIPVDSGTTYAVVLIFDSMVKNRMFKLYSPLEPSLAAVLSTAINLAISESRLELLLPTVSQSVGHDTIVYHLTERILEFIEECESEASHGDVHLDGALHLLKNREYQDTVKARALLEFMSDADKMSGLIRSGMPGTISISIGPENEEPELNDASFVYTAYNIDQSTRGIIGVVAPTRMDYARACAQLAAFVNALPTYDKRYLKSNKDTDTGENDEQEQ